MLKKLSFLLLVPLQLQAAFGEVTDSNFDQVVLRSDRPVVVKAYVPGCSGCQALAPVFSKVSGLYDDRYLFVEINVRSNAGVRNRFNIRLAPTTLFFKNGQEVGRKVDTMTEKVFSSLIEKYLRY